MLPKTSIDETVNEKKERKTKTIGLDFENKCFGEMIDGIEALKQAVYLSLRTKRYEYPIFSHNYGTNYEGVFEEGYMTAIGKLKNAIEDSLLCDDRILNVNDFEFEKKGKTIWVKFTIRSVYGEIGYETEVG